MLLDPPGEGCYNVVLQYGMMCAEQSCNLPRTSQASTSAVTAASSWNGTWTEKSPLKNSYIPCFHGLQTGQSKEYNCFMNVIVQSMYLRWWQPVLRRCLSAQQHVQAAGCGLGPITGCPALPITCHQTADIVLCSLSAYNDRPDEADAALVRYARQSTLLHTPHLDATSAVRLCGSCETRPRERDISLGAPEEPGSGPQSVPKLGPLSCW